MSGEVTGAQGELARSGAVHEQLAAVGGGRPSRRSFSMASIAQEAGQGRANGPSVALRAPLEWGSQILPEEDTLVLCQR